MSPRVLAWLLAIVSFMGATGATQWLLFSEPSLLKYALTVVGPLFAIGLVLVRERLGFMLGVLLVLAPFGTYATTVAGVQVSLLALLVAAVFVLALWERVPGHGRRSPFITLPLGTFAVLLCVAALRSGDVAAALAPLAVIAAFGYALWVFLRDGGDARWISAALIFSASLQGGLAIFSYVSGRTLSLYSGSLASGSVGNDYFFSLGPDVARSAGAFSDPISLGNVLCLAVPYAIIGLTRSLERAQYGLALVLAAASSLIIAGLAVSFSRASWLAFAASTVALIVFVGRGRRESLVLTIGFAGALVAAITSFLGPTLIARAASILTPTSSTVSSYEGDLLREAIWRTSIDVVERFPLLGVGSGNLVPFLARSVGDTTIFSHAHSTYLQVAAEAGLPAAAALVALVLVGLAGSARTVAIARSSAPTAAALTAMSVMWITDYTVRYSPVAIYVVTVVVLGLRAAVIAGSRFDGGIADPAVRATGPRAVSDV